MSQQNQPLLTLGWREWVQLPELGLRNIKAKVDTGARSSALHAFEVETFDNNGVSCVQFKIHPNQRDSDSVVVCTAVLIDERMVRDSGGHREKRWVIATPVRLGRHAWTVECTLTARDDMLFRMLLGRTAIKNRAVVDPSRSYLVGKRLKKKNV
ncbi:MAG: RimK/LysX family protein [Gammaproteobacteria bacterium]|nr:RimK/LysX family protein [Gammaproteobacteria bacterium]MDH5321630.1 RimK/LysX family protein [Gammaproteobacteria bacterium]